MIKKKDTPDILIALSLAYQNGRDYYMGILNYLAQKRRRWNIHLVREGLGLEVLKNEAHWGLDGAIIDYTVHDDAISGIRSLGIPCVALDTAHPDLFKSMRKVAFIDVDSSEIGRLGAQHFTERHNYASYGILAYEDTCNWSERRVRSFSETLGANGLDCNSLRVRHEELRMPALRQTMCEWARRLHRPVAVMVVCDELARMFVSVLSANGIHVPQDVGIVAFDNYPLAEYTDPQLTIIDIDTAMLGEQTAQLLFRRIENKAGNQQIMLSTTLVKRASTERKAR